VNVEAHLEAVRLDVAEAESLADYRVFIFSHDDRPARASWRQGAGRDRKPSQARETQRDIPGARPLARLASEIHRVSFDGSMPITSATRAWIVPLRSISTLRADEIVGTVALIAVHCAQCAMRNAQQMAVSISSVEFAEERIW
jgi:hypothetical protein